METALRGWIRAGLSPDEFWRQTPHLTNLICAARLDRAGDEMRREIVGAWWTARLAKSQTMPKLEDLLKSTMGDGDKPKNEATDAKGLRSIFMQMKQVSDNARPRPR